MNVPDLTSYEKQNIEKMMKREELDKNLTEISQRVMKVEDRVTELEKSDIRLSHQISELAKQVEKLSNNISWLVKIVASSVIGLVFLAIQNFIF